MARNNTARAESIVTLNGKAAESALDALKAKAKEYRQEIDTASKAGDATNVKKLTAELKATEGAMRNVRQQTYDYNTVLKNLNGTSIKELERASKALKNELRNLSPATAEFVAKSKQLDLVKNRLNDLNGRVKESNNWLSRAGNSFNKYFGLATAAIASVTGLSLAFRGAAEAAAKMDDVYADVMKTTGLTREEVVLLNEEFKKLDTRTSREQLNQLARDAGKLGISGKEDVLAFVTAANKINVALREDLGEDAVLTVGKLSEIFQLTKAMGIEKAYAAIGSAINALGQDSSAAEQYLVDFTKRVAGASYQAGLSFQNILGYASALDQSGAQVEMSATAFQNFLMKMYSETETMAKIANMDLKSFANLLSKDVNSAIITVLKGLKDQGGFAQMVPLFKEMGGEGARFVSVLSSLGTNIDMVTKAQSLSNVEFEKATSLQKEYNIKNDTMQARLDKAKKAFQDQVIVLGEQLSPALLKTTNLSTIFLKLIMAIPKWMYAVIGVALAAVAAWKSWSLVIAFHNTLISSGKIIMLAYNAVVYLLEGNIKRAAVSWRALSAAMSASAIGLIVTAISAVAYGFYKWATYQSELTKATKNYYVETVKAKKEASDLLTIIQNSAIGSALYKDAIAKLTELYGPYLAGLINEKGVLTDIEKARTEINAAIVRTIGLKLREQSISDVTTTSLQKQSDFYEDIVQTLVKQGGLSEDVARIQAQSFANSIREGKKWEPLVNKIFNNVGKGFYIAPFRQFANEYKKMVVDIDKTNKQFDFLTKDAPEILGPPKPSGGKSNGETPAQKSAREKQERDDLLKLQQEAADKAAKAKEERFKIELEKLDQQEREKSNLLKKSFYDHMISQGEYEALSTQDTITFLAKRNALYIKYDQDNSATEGQYYEALIKLYNTAYDKMTEKFKASVKEREKIRKKEEDDANNKAQITGNKSIVPIEDTTKEDDLRAKHAAELNRLRDEIREKYSERNRSVRNKKELANLKELLEKKMISEKEYEYAVKEMKLKNALEITQEVNTIVQLAADFYESIKQAEFDRLETQKQKELALAGDNADARAEIEQKYEKKKLDLQIKYADKDMAVKIAQAISAGALAAIQAYAAMGNPVAGAIAAAFVGAVTLAQVASIVAQRNALKSTLQSGTSSSSGNDRKVRGFATGGYTGSGRSDMQPVGIVHANEWVAPAAMVRSNPIVFANLERERVNKYYMSSPPKQFASGGYTSKVVNDFSELKETLFMLMIEIKELKNKPFKGYVVHSEINAAGEIESRIKSQGSK